MRTGSYEFSVPSKEGCQSRSSRPDEDAVNWIGKTLEEHTTRRSVVRTLGRGAVITINSSTEEGNLSRGTLSMPPIPTPGTTAGAGASPGTALSWYWVVGSRSATSIGIVPLPVRASSSLPCSPSGGREMVPARSLFVSIHPRRWSIEQQSHGPAAVRERPPQEGRCTCPAGTGATGRRRRWPS